MNCEADVNTAPFSPKNEVNTHCFDDAVLLVVAGDADVVTADDGRVVPGLRDENGLLVSLPPLLPMLASGFGIVVVEAGDCAGGEGVTGTAGLAPPIDSRLLCIEPESSVLETNYSSCQNGTERKKKIKLQN